MRLSGPVELFRLLGRTRAAVEAAIGLVPPLVELVRTADLLAREAQQFLVDTRATQQQAAMVVAEVETTRRQVQQIADRAGRTENDAAAAVREIRQVAVDVQSLLARFEPALRKLAPLTDFVADELTVEHAEAFTGLIQDAPELVDKLSNDVVPVLGSLDTVGDDLRQVVDSTAQLDEMLGAVPGLGRVKKRVEKKQTTTPRPAGGRAPE